MGQDAEVLRSAFLSNTLPPTERDWTGYNVSYEVTPFPSHALRAISTRMLAHIDFTTLGLWRTIAGRWLCPTQGNALQVLNVSDSTAAEVFTNGEPGEALSQLILP